VPGPRVRGGREETLVFVSTTLLAAVKQEHVQIVQLAERWLIAGRYDLLDQEESGVAGHGTPTVPEDRDAPFVVPVVDDPRQDVDVAAARDHLEEVAAHDLASARDAGAGEVVAGGGDDAGTVEQDAARLGGGSEDRGQERSGP